MGQCLHILSCVRIRGPNATPRSRRIPRKKNPPHGAYCFQTRALYFAGNLRVHMHKHCMAHTLVKDKHCILHAISQCARANIGWRIHSSRTCIAFYMLFCSEHGQTLDGACTRQGHALYFTCNFAVSTSKHWMAHTRWMGMLSSIELSGAHGQTLVGA